ncbi:MAG: hypothetical protein KAR06_01280 [Deltaproteobacteria bacterium]|nr:hypothetical protein [Deltaproteobacteria bacterium]
MKRTSIISALLFAVALLIASCGGGGGGGGVGGGGSNLIGGAIQSGDLGLIDSTTVSVSTFAGNASNGNVDGIGTAAQFGGPYGITTDGDNLFVSDYNLATIRKIDIATATVTTLAGEAGVHGTFDGVGVDAKFLSPVSVTTDGTSVYVASSSRTIRQIEISTGTVTTLAGDSVASGTFDGIGGDAKFNILSGITTDGINLYVTDSINNTIRKVIIATGEVTTLAGDWNNSGSGDGVGTEATFDWPTGITTDGVNLYVGTFNRTIRKIVIETGVVTTLAGKAGVPGTVDGTGSEARFNIPTGLTTDGTNLYVADRENQIIRKVVIATGDVTTIAGQVGVQGGADGNGTAAIFDMPAAITTDGVNLYVTDLYGDSIRMINIATTEVTTLAGIYEGNGFNDGIGDVARFNNPQGITTNGTDLYVSELYNNRVRKISQSAP